MGAVVPIFSDPEYLDRRGAELAESHAYGDDGEQVTDLQGLRWSEKQGKWFHPRVDALQRQSISVEDLDEEELMRGQVRDPDGKFRGGPLRQIPKEFHDELMRRLIKAGTAKLSKHFLDAVDVLVDEVVLDTSVDIALRAKYAQYIIERLGGRTPDVVQHTVAVKPWEVALKGIIREVQTEVVDAEVVEDDE